MSSRDIELKESHKHHFDNSMKLLFTTWTVGGNIPVNIFQITGQFRLQNNQFEWVMGAEITIVAYGLRKNKQERQRYNKEQYKHILHSTLSGYYRRTKYRLSLVEERKQKCTH